MDTLESSRSRPRNSQLEQLLDEARKRLIETGTRNRLIHTNRKAKRTSGLQVVGADVEQVFGRLVRQRGRLRFAADPRASERERRALDAESDNLGGLEEDSDVFVTPGEALQTRLGEANLHKRLTTLARQASTLESEQGINILYFAIGFLRWYEDEKSDVLREAPLILVPATLEVDRRRSTYSLRARDEELETNLPLAERLLDQEGIILPEIPDGEEWTPADYFASLKEAIAHRPRWSIDTGGVELGFFSFAKLLMYRDLGADAWPGDKLVEHPLLGGLLQTGFAPSESELGLDLCPGKLDALIPPRDLVHILDADGSQTIAVERVRRGQNLVIQGPPGTGKSQTIANLIGAAVHDGKSVLFIAEKMVALDVVHLRLKQQGLSRLCLELHSRSANKRAVAEELRAALEAEEDPVDEEAELEELTATRDSLNSFAASLHRSVGPSGRTAFQALGDLTRAKGLGLAPPSVSLGGAANWSAATFDAVNAAILCLAKMPFGEHPWEHCAKLDLQPSEIDRALQQARQAIQDLQALLDRTRRPEIAAYLATSSFHSVRSVHELLKHVAAAPVACWPIISHLLVKNGARLDSLGDELKTVRGHFEHIHRERRKFRQSALEGDHAAARAKLLQGCGSWLRRLFSGGYKTASAELAGWLEGPLPDRPMERLAALEELISLKAAIGDSETIARSVREMLGQHWDGERTHFERVDLALEWLLSARRAELQLGVLRELEGLRALPDGAAHQLAALIDQAEQSVRKTCILFGLDVLGAFGVDAIEKADLGKVAKKLTRLTESASDYGDWVSLYRAEQRLKALGLSALAHSIRSGRIEGSAALEMVRYGRAEQLWLNARNQDPELASLQTSDRSALAKRFADLDRSLRRTVVRKILRQHAAAIPRGSVGDMGVIRGEIARQRGHLPIRRLMARAGRTIQRLKPVFLMSPISVAQFLPPGALEFDLLVIDEASQVRPEDALGVMARAKQLVVVGDSKQLPPTGFFSRLLRDEGDPEEEEEEISEERPLTSTGLEGAAKAAELESVLTLCEARGIPSCLLEWHYRSKHPSLIEISNQEFYKRLLLPPSPRIDREESGLVLRRVNGLYDRGGKRTNEVEAKAVVDAVLAHARSRPERTLGVVTFSSAQATLIATLLDDARRSSPELFDELDKNGEELFIKSLENVQGDERDHIFVSVGYGPASPGGRLYTSSFGPVTREGGERRPNVLFTRARYRCEVFCSFDPAEIDARSDRSRGAAVLYRYLAFAETGIDTQASPTGADPDSPFEEDVAREIQKLGYSVDHQVGTSGFRIDLGVRDPNRPSRYILAVECDGAAYHGALWARERDRLRQEILEGHGWRFHRIWSTDWFYNRAKEIGRLRDALATARQLPPVRSAPTPVEPVVQSPPSGMTSQPPRQARGATLPAYSVCLVTPPPGLEPHETSRSVMAALVRQIIDHEGPIHVEEVGRRIAESFGKERTGSRIQAAVQAGLSHIASLDRAYSAKGQFWATEQQWLSPPVRERSSVPPALQRASLLAPAEFEAAILLAIHENGALSADELPVAVSRSFGFARTGAELRSAIRTAQDCLVSRGQIVIVGDLISVV